MSFKELEKQGALDKLFDHATNALSLARRNSGQSSWRLGARSLDEAQRTIVRIGEIIRSEIDESSKRAS